MHWMKRTLRRARTSIADMGRRVFRGEPSEEVYRARLSEALWSVQGMEIDDVYPAGNTRDEVHR